MSNTVKRYDKKSVLPAKIATEIVRIFEQNYPTSHATQGRETDIEARNSHSALNLLLKKGSVIFTVQDASKNVLGLIEMHEADKGEQGVQMQLVWIIVDAAARDQGVASQLHDAFKAESQKRADRSSKPSYLSLAVHKKNSNAIRVYERWGYTKGKTIQSGKMLMFRDL